MSILRKHGPFIAVAILVMVVPLAVNDDYYLSVLAFMATKLMAVIGLSLLMGQAGQISLGQAAFVGLGAYGSAILVTKWGVDPWLAMAIAATLSASIAGLVGVPTLKLKGHYLAMATLGVNEIIFILLVQLKSLTNGTDGITGIPTLSIGPLDLGEPRVYHVVVWGVALVMLLVSLNLSDSRVGRALRALKRSEGAAESLGVNTSFRKVQVFMVSAVFASIAGSFDAHYVQFISPDSFTIGTSIILVTAVVIGGLGNIWGAAWGTLAIVILPEIIKRFNEDATNLVFGVLLIIIMVFWHGRTISGTHRLRMPWQRKEGGGADSERS